MAKFWFVSAPLRSHTDWGGMLPTALILRRAGHDVRWLSGAGLAEYLKRTGLPFHALAETGWLWPPPPLAVDELAPMEAVSQRYSRALDTWLSLPNVRAGGEALLQAANSLAAAPDVIVSDPFLPAAALVAERLGAKFAVVGMPALRPLDEENLFPVQRQLAAASRERLAQLFAHFGVEGRNFSAGAAPAVLSPDLHLCFFTRGWYQADEANLLPQNRYFGGVALRPPPEDAPAWLREIPAQRPLAIITLGTTFRGELGFYAWAAQAAARAGLLPIITLGEQHIEAEEKATLLAALPPSTRLLQWISFAHVLPRTSLAFQHGGMGTTHALLIHGIPQIVVPHAADQRAQARRVAQAKVGLQLSAHDVRQGMLAGAALALRKDEAVRERALELAKEMSSLGGPARAAQALEEMTVSV